MANFNDACTMLLLKQPFFGSLLMKYKHVENAELNPPTMAVSNTTIFYHPEFTASLSDAECVFVIAHEVMHGVYMHLERMKHYRDVGLGPDGKAYNHMKMNAACDYVVNDSLKVTGVGTMPPVGLWDKKYPYTMTPEEVYCLLDCDDGSGPSNGGSQAGGPPGTQPGFDSHDCDGEPDAAPAVTAVDVMEAANLCKAMRGDLPAGVDRLIGEITKPVNNPWKKLRALVTTALSGYDSSSWRRLQRRMIVRRIGMPGRVACGSGTIGIVVDTSGSIDNDMLAFFGGHMAAIMESARPQCVKVYWTDARVHRVDTIKTPVDLRNLLKKKVPGGGGTDMPRGVDAAMDDKCDAVVVLTDGYTPFGSPHKKKVIWAITSNIKAPHGETVHIEH